MPDSTPTSREKVMSIDSIMEAGATDLSGARANNAIKIVSEMADEASGRFDKLTKFFIAGLTAANAAALSAALGSVRGDLKSDSPLVVSAVLFAAGLTIVLVNPLLNLTKDWFEQRRITREYLKLLNRGAGDQPLKLMDVMLIIRHALPPWWYGISRLICNGLSALLFVAGLWWPIIVVLKAMF